MEIRRRENNQAVERKAVISLRCMFVLHPRSPPPVRFLYNCAGVTPNEILHYLYY